jgi:hypothetical protein
VLGAVAADSDSPYGDDNLVTDHWVLNDLYYGSYRHSCCENGYSGVAISRRSDGSVVNWVAGAFGEDGDLWYLSNAGTVCWTDTWTDATTSPTTEVVIQKAGRPNDYSSRREVLETGVVLDSLKLEGSTLSWVRDDGTQRKAQVD